MAYGELMKIYWRRNFQTLAYFHLLVICHGMYIECIVHITFNKVKFRNNFHTLVIYHYIYIVHVRGNGGSSWTSTTAAAVWPQDHLEWGTQPQCGPVPYITLYYVLYSTCHEICTQFVLCYAVWLVIGGFPPFSSGLLHWHWGNHMIAPVPVKQP